MEQGNHSSNISSTSGTTNNTVGFFVLPRELRDAVYDHLPMKVKGVPQEFETDLQLRVRHGPRQTYLLVNRQFRSELLERSAKMGAHLIVEDRRQYRGAMIKVTPPLKKAVRAELHLGIRQKRGYGRGGLGREAWFQLEDFVQLVLNTIRLEGIPMEVNLYLGLDVSHEEYECLILHNSNLILHKNMRELLLKLHVYRCDLGDDEWDFPKEKELVITYCHETGELQRASEVQQHS